RPVTDGAGIAPVEIAQPTLAPGVPTSSAGDTVARERYDDAIDEIEHLRLRLQEAEASLKKSESRARKLADQTDTYRARIDRTAARLERLIERLG
ncbi:MAG TPA: hypothetical protein VD788_15755, partial [Candidatus Polarisedimenticolaceae bacterium]|nr:hypothetical protein [Candidatus Polarisedimenticolaceae bacterium]